VFNLSSRSAVAAVPSWRSSLRLPRSHQQQRSSCTLLPALQSPAAAQQLLSLCPVGEHTGVSRETDRAGSFASIPIRVLQYPRMQYGQKFSSFHPAAALARSAALHCSSSAHSLSSTQHALCSHHFGSQRRHCSSASALHARTQASSHEDFALRPSLPSLPSFAHFFAALSFASRLACVILLSASLLCIMSLAHGYGGPSVPSVSVLPLSFLSFSPLGRLGARARWLAPHHGRVSGRRCDRSRTVAPVTM